MKELIVAVRFILGYKKHSVEEIIVPMLLLLFCPSLRAAFGFNVTEAAIQCAVGVFLSAEQACVTSVRLLSHFFLYC